MANQEFFDLGTDAGEIPVRISYRTIQLFSEGLYSSPHKAIEELVSNAFDAGARHVHVIVPKDPTAPGAAIVVIDDGTGMNASALEQLWEIGESPKRSRSYTAPRGRKPIGKFGIGKLATYVLAERLTHITRTSDGYLSTSMDFGLLSGHQMGSGEQTVVVPRRKLTAPQARVALAPWHSGQSAAQEALPLFGRQAARTWTVAVMSDLKPLSQALDLGVLKRVLSASMPLRPDFRLFLNDKEIQPKKVRAKRIGQGKWVIGKDLTPENIGKPAPEFTVVESPGESDADRWAAVLPHLGRVTGFLEIFEKSLTDGKDKFDRSNGFFVYVHGRLINYDDPGFGIGRETLQHRTFNQIRVVVHMDRLDDELRSSREAVRSGTRRTEAENFLRGIFNFARTEINSHERASEPGEQLGHRLAQTPQSLTTEPIVRMVQRALAGKAEPRYITVPSTESEESGLNLIDTITRRVEETQRIVTSVAHVEHSPHDPLALLRTESGTLEINLRHPFVAHFATQFERRDARLPLEMFAMAEVLLEASLHDQGLPPEDIDKLLQARDEFLRALASSVDNRNGYHVADALLEAATDEDALETEVVEAFKILGYAAWPKGGRDAPDGVAEAALGIQNGRPAAYRISLEAKSSKERLRLDADQIKAAKVARHRDESDCQHAVVVARGFVTKNGAKASTLIRDIEREAEKSRGKAEKESKSKRMHIEPSTITLMSVETLASLLRLHMRRPVNLLRLRGLLQTCVRDEECQAWIAKLEAEKVEEFPAQDVLDAVQELQKERSGSPVTPDTVSTWLLSKKQRVDEDQIANWCRLVSQYTDGLSFDGKHIALRTNPATVLRELWTRLPAADANTQAAHEPGALSE